MPKPIPNTQYTVVRGDTLSNISARAYGDQTLWRRIWSANQTRLKSGDPNLIYPGEVIIIPPLPERTAAKDATRNAKSGRDKNKITIIVDGREIQSTAKRTMRTMDTAADGFTASMEWEPGRDLKLDKILAPYSYAPAQVYIGDERLVTGLIYSVEPSKSQNGTVQNLEGFSLTADLVDSTIQPPYERNNVTLKQVASEVVKPLGIGVVFDVSEGGAFDRVTADENDSIFSHLSKLAAQRSILISSTVQGELLFTKAKAGKPVAMLEEDQQGALEYQAKFDGRQRFNAYRVIGRSPLGNKDAVAKDNKVPRSRFVTIRADETTSGDIGQAAKWRRSKSLVEALTINFPVVGWYNQQGNLWRENTIVTVKSPTLHLANGFDFIIRAVEYVEENGGRTANLSLVPPQVYTGEELVDPWT